MYVKGKVQDFEDKKPLPAASVVVVDKWGNNMGEGTTANADGSFQLISLMLDQGNFLKFSHTGYYPTIFQPLETSQTQIFEIEKKTDEYLPPVVVTPGNETKKNHWIVALWFAAGWFVLSNLKNMKRGL